MSSLTSADPSTGKGSGSASDRTSTSSATTSISPVGSSGFSLPAGRVRTVPVTSTQNSARRSWATASSPRHTTCTTPLASRRSMKTTPPWSRRRATQPDSTTCSPACAVRSVPASWVRIIGLCPSRSNSQKIYLPNGAGYPPRCRLQSPPRARLGNQVGQERVRPALGADRGLRPVPGQHHGLVRHRQADPRQAAQDRGVVAAGQVGAPDRPRKQQVTGKQYVNVDFAFTLRCNRRARGKPECDRSFGMAGRVVHDYLESHQAQGHPVGQFFYIVGFGEFQAAEQLLPRAERKAPGRIAEHGAVVRVDVGRDAFRAADRGDRPDVVDMAVREQDSGRPEPVLGQDLVDRCFGVLTRIDDHALLAGGGRNYITVGRERASREPCDEHKRPSSRYGVSGYRTRMAANR